MLFSQAGGRHCGHTGGIRDTPWGHGEERNKHGDCNFGHYCSLQWIALVLEVV